jgi:hypothetical protein
MQTKACIIGRTAFRIGTNGKTLLRRPKHSIIEVVEPEEEEEENIYIYIYIYIYI